MFEVCKSNLRKIGWAMESQFDYGKKTKRLCFREKLFEDRGAVKSVDETFINGRQVWFKLSFISNQSEVRIGGMQVKR
jgi:hypothetical protein